MKRSPRKKTTRESKVEKHVCAVVKAAGGIAYKFKSPQRKNVPDRICILPNDIFFVECKAPGKKPTAAQLREHERLRALGVRVYVVDNMEWSL